MDSTLYYQEYPTCHTRVETLFKVTCKTSDHNMQNYDLWCFHMLVTLLYTQCFYALVIMYYYIRFFT